MSFDYVVVSPQGVPVLHTSYKALRYAPKIEAQMLDLGYKITISGKRLTKKEAAERMKSKRK